MNQSKKQVLFVIQSLYRATAAIALLERLHKLPRKEYAISLLLLGDRHDRDLLGKIPSDVLIYHRKNLVLSNINSTFYSVAVFAEITDNHMDNTLIDAVSFPLKHCHSAFWELYLFQAFHRQTALARLFFDINSRDSLRALLSISEKFTRVRTKKHPLRDTVVKATQADLLSELLQHFHNIFTENYTVKSTLLRKYPKLAGRTHILPDTLQRERIHRLCAKAREGFDGLRLLTVSESFCHEDYRLLLRTAVALKKRGFHFKWNVVCSKSDKLRLDFSSKRLDIEEQLDVEVISPAVYPLFGMCDIYVSLDSRAYTYAFERPAESPLLAGAGHIKSEINLSSEIALILTKPIIALSTPLQCRLLEWEEDVVLSEPHPYDIADAVEYICMEIFSDEAEPII